MTLQELKLFFAFNAWATNRVLDVVDQMPEDAVMRDMKASHGSIHGTLLHLVGAERVWLDRWTGTVDAHFLQPEAAPTRAALREVWNDVGFRTAQFLSSVDDKSVQGLFPMKTSKGEALQQVYWQSMVHLVDHSTFHRGQVVTLMRQQGVVPPATGMIAFFRETSKLGKH